MVNAGSPRKEVLDHEAALLGLLLHRPVAVTALPVRAEHYRQPLHGVIHDAVVEAAQQHGPEAGVLHIAEILRTRRDIPNLMARLKNGIVLTDYMAASQLAGGTPDWHAERILDAWRRRHVRALGGRLQQLADGDNELTDIVDDALTSILDTVPADHWDPPTPLAPRRALPPFPVEALPGWAADHVAALAEFTQTPPDLAGCVTLAALSAAAGGKATVQIRHGWVEPVNLYTVIAMAPGSRKSAVFATVTAPLLAAEQHLVAQARPAIIDAQLAQRTAHADAERHATNAARTAIPDARTEALGMAADAELAADQIHIPPMPRLIADDITPEAAASLLAEQGGRLAVLSAEGGIFTTLAGRYTGTPNLEVFLKGHAGDLLRVDRKGRPAEHIAAPALTLGLAIQPEVLREIARAPGFRGRGLLARILYSLPENTVGRRRIGSPAVPDHIASAYDMALQSFALTLAERTELLALGLDPDANHAMLNLEKDLEPRLADDGELGELADWAAKLNGTIARIAGLLHLAEQMPHVNRAITTPTIDAAARLGHYYLAHALAVFDHMHADPIIDGARLILDWIHRTGVDKFTRRDYFSVANRSRFKTTTDLDPCLQRLEQHGYIRQLPTPPASARGGRRRSPTYLVNPHR